MNSRNFVNEIGQMLDWIYFVKKFGKISGKLKIKKLTLLDDNVVMNEHIISKNRFKEKRQKDED